jgi:hypothetical protein
VIEFERFLARVVDGVERGALTQQEAAHYLGEHVARRLYCSSASLWSLAGPPGLRVITRVGGFDASANRPLVEPLQMMAAGASAWHDELAERRVFASDDAQRDARLAPVQAVLVVPSRVRGLLQAAIGANGGLDGFVSCVQHDAARAWTPREATQLQRMAVALSVRRSRDGKDSALALPVSRAST